jgi:predicted phosphodiesterase
MIRLMSDLHLEMSKGDMDIPVLPTDKETVLVLAGDIGVAKSPNTYTQFIEKASKQFQDVVWICGNHEYYGSSMLRAIPKIEVKLSEMQLPNVHFGDCFTVVINDTAFICATLWTDMNNQDPFTMYSIRTIMADFAVIRTGSIIEPYKRRIRPIDLVGEFKVSKQFIFDEIKSHQDQGHKTVVVTHHGPCSKSIHEMYASQTTTNGAYVSELGNDIVDAGGPNLWVHGHTHMSFDYMIGDNTRVVVNPRGYASIDQINPDFDPNLTIDC